MGWILFRAEREYNCEFNGNGNRNDKFNNNGNRNGRFNSNYGGGGDGELGGVEGAAG